jgi:hypothetical protein
MVLVKADESSHVFRDRMESLRAFAEANDLPESLVSAMKEHLELQSACEHKSDDQVAVGTVARH